MKLYFLVLRSQHNQFEILGSIRTDYTENVESSERVVGELQLGTKIGKTRWNSIFAEQSYGE